MSESVVKQTDENNTDGGVSKKGAKKAEKNAAKEQKKQEQQRAQQEQQKAQEEIINKTVEGIENETHGYLALDFTRKQRGVVQRTFTEVPQLDDTLNDQLVWVRGRLQDIRVQGAMVFCTLRHRYATVQLLGDTKGTLDKNAIKWISSVPVESIIDVYGTVKKPDQPITSTSQQVEVHIQKVFCFSKAQSVLPFQLRDASQPEMDVPEEGAITVGQDVRLDNRVLDLRTPQNQAIFMMQSLTCQLFREILIKWNFVEIHSPKLIGGVSEGGSNAFTLQYFGRPACLAQSPQLYKQMAICSDFNRVFEIAPVFRAENSNTHRHLCEFVGLDMEMAFKDSYHEVLDLLDDMFKFIFDGLTNRGAELVKVVKTQYDVEPFKWIENTPRLEFEDGINMLRADGATGIPDDLSSFDLSTELEKRLGRLVRAKYHTDFYMLIRYPLGVRPFYTMPEAEGSKWSNSYDFFMRGEEIVSGAQRIHHPGLLTERAQYHNIDVATLQPYIDSFKLGAEPHGGAGIGLERVVMLFLGLGNIRKTSLFPRDPKRLAP